MTFIYFFQCDREDWTVANDHDYFVGETGFAIFLRTIYRQDWVVYAKPPFDGPEHVLHYLARYTCRVAISNHRLLSVSADGVCFGPGAVGCVRC